ncbi:MAG TPA: hypothetical protein VJX66_28365 [Amycolatopsis sp.]|nr:hypothetical protein [Amycolatopsis sp.]
MLMADGGGGSFTDNIGLGVQQVKQVSQETQKLVDAAKGGGFKITPEGVAPLRNALAQMATMVTSMRQNIYALSRAPQLGSHPYGHTVASHDQKSASEQAGSAMSAVDQLQQVLAQADEALARAAGLYKEAEHQATSASTTIQV